MIHRIIVWFRNDLRVHDNYILKTAMNTVERSNLKNKAGGAKVTTEVLPVFCFDPRFYDAMTPFGTKKCGFNRTRFILESVANLRKNLQAVGSDLIVSHEPVESFIPKLVPKHRKDLAPGDVREVTSLLYQEEVCYEELQQENALKKALKRDKVNVMTRWGSTIYHYDDMATSPEDSASIYGNFIRQSN